MGHLSSRRKWRKERRQKIGDKKKNGRKSRADTLIRGD
jgi:hypothetical protein